MRIRSFEYFAAPTLDVALVELDRYGSEAKILAGGTDLVPSMKMKQTLPQRVISLHQIQELDFVREQGNSVRVGALAKHADLADNSFLKLNLPILCEAVGLIGSWQIRNIGTIGGNICTASPAADSVTSLMVLDAQLVVADTDGKKSIPINTFFIGPGMTALEPNQIVKEIVIELPRNPSTGCYMKLRRNKAVDCSLAGVAFQAEADPETRTLSKVGIALGSVAPTPIRASQAEAILTGLSLEEALHKIPECAQAAVEATSPIDDVRASAEYRQIIIDLFVRQCAEKVIKTLRNGGGTKNNGSC